jgi:protein involved in sex pheromone biosynthesis
LKKKIAGVFIATSLLLGGCGNATENQKEKVIEDIKNDMSIEYQVPIEDIKVETIEFGITRFTTSQFKVTIESTGQVFNLVDTENSYDFTRYPVPEEE